MLTSVQQTKSMRPHAVVYAPSFFRTDEALLVALRHGHRGARAVFYERQVADVELLLVRLVGVEEDLTALTHAVFLEAVRRLPRLAVSSDSLRPWLMRLAVREAERVLRRRRVRSLLSAQRFMHAGRRLCQRMVSGLSYFRQELSHRPVAERALSAEECGVRPRLAPDFISSNSSVSGSTSGTLGLQVYALLDRLPVRLRVAFCLHYLAKLDIGEVAELCDVSLVTARRAVLFAKYRFTEVIRTSPAAAHWLAR